MYSYETHTTDPCRNHAIELYLLKDRPEEFFLFWSNGPACLIGAHQIPEAELDLAFCREEGIEVVRRLSGGGTILTGPENLQFSFIAKRTRENSFERFSKPILYALKKMGVEAQLTGRNDLVVDGAKISGNAKYVWKDRVLHHGTLLYDIDRRRLEGALRPNPIKYRQKALTSVQSRVTTLKEKLDMPIEEFIRLLYTHVSEYYGARPFQGELEEEKLEEYRAFFKDPNRTFPKRESKLFLERKRPSGLYRLEGQVEGNHFVSFSLCGDYFCMGDPSRLEDRVLTLTFPLEEGLPFSPEDWIDGYQKAEFQEDLEALFRLCKGENIE